MTEEVGSNLEISHGSDTTDKDAGSSPIFSFGVASDVQYADIPNQMNYSKTSWRYYRNSATILETAASTWSKDRPKPSFAVHLGDLIDGFNSKLGKANSESALKVTLSKFDKFDGPIHYVVGNHEFYNFTGKELRNSRLNTSKLGVVECAADQRPEEEPDQLDECGCKKPLYYKFNPHPGFCFVVLDTYDVSGLAHVKDCPLYKEAMKILCAVNKNEGFMLNSSQDLVGLQKRFVMYNGGIGKEQMIWLSKVLLEATQKAQRVFILCHVPLNPETDTPQCLLWNYDEVLQTLHSSDCVVAILCGHTHKFAYFKDAQGIHHVTLPGIVEVEPGDQAFATIDVYRHHCRVRGVGQMPSLDLEYAIPNRSETDFKDDFHGNGSNDNDTDSKNKDGV